MAGGAIGVLIKSLLLVLEKSHNLVFSGVDMIARHKIATKATQDIFGIFFSKRRCKQIRVTRQER